MHHSPSTTHKHPLHKSSCQALIFKLRFPSKEANHCHAPLQTLHCTRINHRFPFSALSLFTDLHFSFGSAFNWSHGHKLPQGGPAFFTRFCACLCLFNHTGLLCSLKQYPFLGLWDVFFQHPPPPLCSTHILMRALQKRFSSLIPEEVCKLSLGGYGLHLSHLLQFVPTAFVWLFDLPFPQGPLRAHFHCHCNIPVLSMLTQIYA